MESSLGVKSPSTSQIMIVSSPVGPYYPTGFNPISLLCETHHIRSAPGGTGGFKLGGYLFFLFRNYGPTISVGNHAQKRGHQQVLWLWNNKIG
jgi:branched-chain amino acid aminotransferase